jgi:hypothetical protein
MFIYVEQCVRPEELRTQNVIFIRFDCSFTSLTAVAIERRQEISKYFVEKAHI